MDFFEYLSNPSKKIRNLLNKNQDEDISIILKKKNIKIEIIENIKLR